MIFIKDIDIPRRMGGESSDNYIVRLQELIMVLGHEITYWRDFYSKVYSITGRLDSVVDDVMKRKE